MATRIGVVDDEHVHPAAAPRTAAHYDPERPLPGRGVYADVGNRST
jgi:hypothetical protein